MVDAAWRMRDFNSTLNIGLTDSIRSPRVCVSKVADVLGDQGKN